MKQEKKDTLLIGGFAAVLLVVVIYAVFLRSWIGLPSGYTGAPDPSFVVEQQDAYPLGTPGFVVTVHNNGEHEVEFLNYHLEMLRGGRWYRLKQTIPEERVLEVPGSHPGGTTEVGITLEWLDREPKPGSYRAVFPIGPNKDYFAVYFELTEP